MEDDRDVRESIRDLLEDFGYQVICAAEGQEALDLLRDGQPRPALILLDLMMNGLNGYGFLAARGEDPALKDIPVVVLTAQGTASAQIGSLPTEPCLRKPFDFEELLAMIERHAAVPPP